MGYKEQLNSLVDRYYQDVLEKYKVTAMEAAQKGKKLSLFKKQNYQPCIAGFREHRMEAEAILKELKLVQVDSKDKYGKALKSLFVTNLEDFTKLCERNEEHYDLMEKKQYSGSGITSKDLKLSFAGLNAAMGPAVESLDILDRAHKLFNGEDVQVDEADLIRPEKDLEEDDDE